MKIKEYKKIAGPLSKRTLIFLTSGNEILLGEKKSGFGKGKWLGISGSVEQGETIEEAMVRETVEEIGVTPKNYVPVAVLSFYFPYEKAPENWNQRVHVYKTDQWEGNITESDEIAPKWYKILEMPFDLMWSDARYWLRRILNGEKLKADFLFDKNLEVEESIIINGL